MFSKPMTTFTPERIEQILEFAEGSNPSEAMSLRADEVAVLARIGKAVMSIAPVYQCEFCHHDATGQLQWHWEDVNKAFYDKIRSRQTRKTSNPLYRPADAFSFG